MMPINDILRHVCISVQKEDGELISLYNATKSSSKNKEYFCIECNEQVMLKEGKIKTRHFAHYPGSTCTFFERKGESMMHLTMKEIVKEFLEKGGTLDIMQNECNRHMIKIKLEEGDKVVLEYISSDRAWIADICILDSTGQPKQIIEICHSHKTEDRPYDWVEFSTRDLNKFCDIDKYILTDSKLIFIRDIRDNNLTSPIHVTKKKITYDDGTQRKNPYKSNTFHHSFYRKKDLPLKIQQLYYLTIEDIHYCLLCNYCKKDCIKCWEDLYEKLLVKNNEKRESDMKQEDEKKQKEEEYQRKKEEEYQRKKEEEKRRKELYEKWEKQREEQLEKEKKKQVIRYSLDTQLKYKKFFYSGGKMIRNKICEEEHETKSHIEFDKNKHIIIINAHLLELNYEIQEKFVIIYNTFTQTFQRLNIIEIEIESGYIYNEYINSNECKECIKKNKKEMLKNNLPERFQHIKKEIKGIELEIETINKSDKPNFNMLRDLRKRVADLQTESKEIKSRTLKQIK